jgi:hypothetical protein
MSYEVFAQLLMNGAVLYLAYQIYRLSQKPINVKIVSRTIKGIDTEPHA